MRNPARKRNASAVTATALGVITFAFHWLGASDPAHDWRDFVAAISGSFALLALIAIPIYQIELSRFHRLMRGVDVIARWFVSPGDWKQFVLDEPARNARSGKDPNIVELSPPIPAEGVEVIVGKNALMVGGDFYSLPRVGIDRIRGPEWIDGAPPCLEFAISSPSPSQTSMSDWTLRFPVARSAIGAAQEVQSHYQTRSPETLRERDPKRMRSIGIVITAIGLTLGASGLLLNGAINSSLLVIMLVSGALITPAGLIVAIVWHRQMPPKRKKYPY